MKKAIVFECGSAKLLGILHIPSKPASKGVVVIVGGPQYRVGSHRQFYLLSQSLEQENIASFRFDYQGMGDSSGQKKNFEDVEDDIQCAIDVFMANCPEITEVVLWGICDAASAILFYAHKDTRVTGIVLLNPWVRTLEGESRTFLRHYYIKKMMSPETWTSIISGNLNIYKAFISLLNIIKNAYYNGSKHKEDNLVLSLPERMLNGYKKFKGMSQIIISGNDLTAMEFVEVTNSSSEWKDCLAGENVTWKNYPEANHTFSSKLMRDNVSDWTVDWLRTW